MALIVAVSDTHLKVPEDFLEGIRADLLIIAGDVLMAGHAGEWGRFLLWLEKIRGNFTNIAYVPGNHDIFVEQHEFMVKGELKYKYNVDMLVDQLKVYNFAPPEEGPPVSVDDDLNIQRPGQVKVYGAPWIPLIGREKRWAYELPRGKALAKQWDMIPEGLDFLVTHGPPQYIMDNIIYYWNDKESDHWGCGDLRKRLFSMKRKPTYHIYGHIHSPVQGKEWCEGGIQFHNVAICDEEYLPRYTPRFIEI